jgi:hypothetical protein
MINIHLGKMVNKQTINNCCSFLHALSKVGKNDNKEFRKEILGYNCRTITMETQSISTKVSLTAKYFRRKIACNLPEFL